MALTTLATLTAGKAAMTLTLAAVSARATQVAIRNNRPYPKQSVRYGLIASSGIFGAICPLFAPSMIMFNFIDEVKFAKRMRKDGHLGYLAQKHVYGTAAAFTLIQIFVPDRFH